MYLVNGVVFPFITLIFVKM